MFFYDCSMIWLELWQYFFFRRDVRNFHQSVDHWYGCVRLIITYHALIDSISFDSIQDNGKSYFQYTDGPVRARTLSFMKFNMNTRLCSNHNNNNRRTAKKRRRIQYKCHHSSWIHLIDSEISDFRTMIKHTITAECQYTVAYSYN